MFLDVFTIMIQNKQNNVQLFNIYIQKMLIF